MKKEFIKFLQILAVGILFFIGQNIYAEGETIDLTIKNEGAEVVSLNLALPQEGMISINDSGGNSQEVDARSVLNIIYNADNESADFDISELTYYSSFGAFYLKCISINGDELCDNWLYKVNDQGPSVGMDQNILSGGETIVLYYGSDEEPENPPEPEPEPEPEAEETHRSSGGSRARRRIETKVVAPDPVLEVAPETSAVVVNEPVLPPPVVIPMVPDNKDPVVSKPAPKKVTTIGEVASKNSATVIEAETANVIEQPPAQPKKDGWFKTILKWLFGF
jgi:hypothetical protein